MHDRDEVANAPAQPLTRADWVDRKLREAILSGELQPGQRLRPADLSKQWSVSPTPLREAFQRLAAEGLVEMFPQRGARVAPVTMRDAFEVHQIRLALEPVALRLALENADEDWQARVGAAYERLAADLRAGAEDRRTIEELHRTYHMELLSNCTSAWLLKILDMLQSHVIRYWILVAPPRRDTRRVLDEHARLHELCVGGKTNAAVAELTAHLQAAFDRVGERMTQTLADGLPER